PVPSSVKVELAANRVKVEGPKGALERTLPAQVSIKMDDGQILCERPTDGREHRSLHGLTRTLVANMVTGVSQGFTKHLELVGVGYRVSKQGDDLVLNLSFSHPAKVSPRLGISTEVTGQTKVWANGASHDP